MENDFGSVIGKPGSIHTRRMNFAPNERVFSSKDVPEKARQARQEVLNTLISDELGLSKPKWNPDTGVGAAHFEQRAFQRTLAVNEGRRPNYNYRAETLDDFKSDSASVYPALPASKFAFAPGRSSTDYDATLNRTVKTVCGTQNPRAREMSIHPDLEKKSEWNFSTTLDRNKLYQQSANVKPSTRFKVDPPVDYISPQERNDKMRDELREQKLIKATEAERLTETYGVNYKDVLQRKEKVHERQDTKKPVARKHEKIKLWKHTGAYTYSPSEGAEAWSCCMNWKKDSQGCSPYFIDKDKWNTQHL
eukprot:GCRY01004487.1.p1 GENE.GCRY01004487.1~~GCRY01004487.1.p1  ORF type:complete len:306 (-),score=45.29 GCRY01004487.1:19-936(-)